MGRPYCPQNGRPMGQQSTGMAATYRYHAAWVGLPKDGPMIWSRLREYPGCGLQRIDHRGDLSGRPMPDLCMTYGRNEAEWMDG
ncbi:hypothetical protein RR48_10178 [Papilio machaon]|uniref:Uncharacterized protein n=1 Tax=Papilio machaon TaxID=76193 RepID=A0A194QZN0_PAPMA|nr:hypothetical protein RR48_10178 [Papilio machaon]